MSIPKKVKWYNENEFYMLLRNRRYEFLEACKQSNAELQRNVKVCKEYIDFWNEHDNAEEVCKEKLYLDIYEEVLRKRGFIKT